MPVKKDASKRWVEMEYLLPGPPEEIWRAMATGPGYAAWFANASIEERVGGALRFSFGPEMISSGEVTVWEPPFRFGYVETEWMDGAPPCVTEITITSRTGGQCVVRMVHALFTSKDDWDDQLESFEGGWPGFFEVLRIYLAHFAGQKGASFQAMVRDLGEEDLPVWMRLIEALGLTGANVGEHREITSGPEKLSGVVERVHQDRKTRWITLKLDAPGPGVAILGTYCSNGVHASMSLFSYGDDAETRARESEPKWRAWLEGIISVCFRHSTRTDVRLTRRVPLTDHARFARTLSHRSPGLPMHRRTSLTIQPASVSADRKAASRQYVST